MYEKETRIVLEGLRSEKNIAELCWREPRLLFDGDYIEESWVDRTLDGGKKELMRMQLAA
ncbi:hypothetical protein [Aliiroseovarius sp.]|uniref:hypothetical protein n=1 Tax=Aliiroseovarius sp. TaxID=1872442 RepID=UPI003BAB968F